MKQLSNVKIGNIDNLTPRNILFLIGVGIAGSAAGIIENADEDWPYHFTQAFIRLLIAGIIFMYYKWTDNDNHVENVENINKDNEEEPQ